MLVLDEERVTLLLLPLVRVHRRPMPLRLCEWWDTLSRAGCCGGGARDGPATGMSIGPAGNLRGGRAGRVEEEY